jgi:hypothetical protein
MTRAEGLLLSCLRKEPEKARCSSLQGISHDEWEEILTAAVQYSVTPLLFDILKPLFPRLDVPENVRQEMHDGYYRSAVRNMRLYKKLLETIAVFNTKGIPVILLKGAHLAELVYGNIALRPMSDADILVRKEDLRRADILLIEQGYCRSPLEKQGSALEHLAPYIKSDAADIEVHFHITGPPFSRRFDPTALWERAHRQTLQGVEVLTLCPGDLLLHLCVHACIHHGFDNGIMPALDVDRVIERYGAALDWEELMRRGREWGLDRCVLLMLSLTERLLGTHVPESVRRGMALCKELPAALAAAEELMFVKGPSVPAHIARLFGDEGWRTKVRYFTRRAFPPADGMLTGEERGKPVALARQYLLRWKGVLERHGKTVLAGIMKEPRALAALELQKKRNRLTDWLQRGGK